jgi:hypothetical protein
MVRKYLRKKEKTYNEEKIQLGIEAVRAGMKISTAAKTYKIPRSTLRDKMSGHRQMAKRPGAKTVLTMKQEQVLVDRLLYLSDRGFPVTSDWLRCHAYSYARKLGRRHLLQKSIPTNWKKNW